MIEDRARIAWTRPTANRNPKGNRFEIWAAHPAINPEVRTPLMLRVVLGVLGDWTHRRSEQVDDQQNLALLAFDRDVQNALGTGATFVLWHWVPLAGSPWQVAWVESYDGRMRDEHLDGQLFDTLFDTLFEALVLNEAWRVDYENRPHSTHGWKTPADFAAAWHTDHQHQLA